MNNYGHVSNSFNFKRFVKRSFEYEYFKDGTNALSRYGIKKDYQIYKYINIDNKKDIDLIDDNFYVHLYDINASYFPISGIFCLNTKSFDGHCKPIMDTAKVEADMDDSFYKSLSKNDRETLIGTAIEVYHLNVFFKKTTYSEKNRLRQELIYLLKRLKGQVEYDCFYTRLEQLLENNEGLIIYKKQKFTLRTLGGDFGATGFKFSLFSK